MGWTVKGQRHCVGLKALLNKGALLTGLVPGVIWRGDDVGRWLARQQREFGRLNAEQQTRIAKCGMHPAAVPARMAPAAGGAGQGRCGAQRPSHAQCAQREQRTVVPRQHTEHITVGTKTTKYAGECGCPTRKADATS
ncbi:hypothetical protein [Streptomyces sp. NPDC059928]